MWKIENVYKKTPMTLFEVREGMAGSQRAYRRCLLLLAGMGDTVVLHPGDRVREGARIRTARLE
jgi:hypothetical protein